MWGGLVLSLLAVATTAAAATTAATPLVCDATLAAWQADQFREKSSTTPGWANCGDMAWMQKWQELEPSGPKVMLDIGCNKGYESVEFVDVFAPELGISKPSLFQHYNNSIANKTGLCGACNRCTDKSSTPPNLGVAKQLVVHCFEPAKLNHDRTQHAILTMGWAHMEQGNSRLRWHMYPAAIGKTVGLVDYSHTECNHEECGVENASGRTVKVPATTVDHFLERHDLEHVDFLKIDTEGLDPDVIAGSMKALKRKAVTAMVFEYHQKRVWKNTTLESVVGMLDNIGYACYFDGKPTLTKLSSNCFSPPSFEFKWWSNVVCVNKKHGLYALMDQLSFLALKRLGL